MRKIKKRICTKYRYNIKAYVSYCIEKPDYYIDVEITDNDKTGHKIKKSVTIDGTDFR